ncbi:GNAT family N-acetyltransferase [Halobacteriovorax sp. GB3]|uniref:GNAT family N-acetyltransferase n=1 Tax=Halobacteriovorax sp. GB3 TaxID=2719615 RepID=UPI002362CDF9|nr:GNAT family N-acetyltransferase [Halobacteriovorax sp. GB3]MDD0854565.1 GNAT family N-acetyltransferase [Halobacteriovorax sp. GB3]
MKAVLKEYIHTNLARNPEFLIQTLGLIEKSFQYPKEHSFETDFYPLLNPHNYKNCHILLNENKEVIAHVGVKLRTLNFKETNSPVALLGGICMREDYRGKGIFKAFFNECINIYSTKVSFFLLWSDKSELYGKFSFFQAGGIIQTGDMIIDPEYLPPYLEKAELSPKTMPDIRYCYKSGIEGRFLTLKREESDWNDFMNIKSANLYFIKNSSSVDGYLLCGKGADLKDVIHEVAFAQNEAFHLEKLSEYQLWLSESEYKRFKSKKTIYMGLFKVGNHLLFQNFINAYTRGLIKVIKIDQDNVHFNFENSNITMDMSEFLQIIFGPSRATELSKCEPLYISGMDSI